MSPTFSWHESILEVKKISHHFHTTCQIFSSRTLLRCYVEYDKFDICLFSVTHILIMNCVSNQWSQLHKQDLYVKRKLSLFFHFFFHFFRQKTIKSLLLRELTLISYFFQPDNIAVWTALYYHTKEALLVTTKIFT